MGNLLFKKVVQKINSNQELFEIFFGIDAELLGGAPFTVWAAVNGKEKVMCHGRNGILISTTVCESAIKSEVESKAIVGFSRILFGGRSDWRMPFVSEIGFIANHAREKNLYNIRKYVWADEEGVRVDTNNFSSNSAKYHEESMIIPVMDISILEVMRTVLKMGWWVEYNEKRHLFPPDYSEFDYQMVRLPKVSNSNAELALWEFHNVRTQKIADIPDEQIAKFYAKGRDPALDLKDCNVAIDFGTSSTVVAYEEADRHKLLRIGMLDFWQPEKPEHFENPTVLEFLDVLGMLETWRRDAYRPFVDWDEVRCAHTALASLRDNNADPKVVASILPKLKHWALNERHRPRRQFTDQKGITQTLPHLTARMPVKGQLLKVTPDDPLDPIELYAWYLGLTINWRGRGIFLRYYMTFPVAYPTEVKDKILASFRRGLLRSLPHSMAVQTEAMRDFCVEERASEPAAYAAAALPQLGIAPTPSGVHYAVFDFGGGTTDFDFGVYRSPNAAEEDEGWEQVFEHYGADGDKFLGGENILENMVYIVFKHNLDVCRKHSISFSKPLDALDFPGSELLLDNSMATTVNNIRLTSKLRSMFEGSNMNLGGEGMLQIDLLNNTGTKVACQLAVPITALHG